MKDEINTIRQLELALQQHPDSALVFTSNGQQIYPEYHVTEIKHARISAVDCGRGSDSWNEIIIQLLDGAQDGSGQHMTAGKFQKIVNAAAQALPSLESDQLFFEFASGNSPMQRLTPTSIVHHNGTYIVQLAGDYAACKPALRAAPGSDLQGCCAGGGGAPSCCS